MELSKETMKKLALLIAFAAVCFTVFQWIDGVAAAFRFLRSLLGPFVLGGILAFIFNVPMRYLEKRLFPAPSGNKKGLSPGLRRLLSLVITLLLLVAVILILVLVIAPELANTVAGLSDTVQDAITRFLLWAETVFADNPQMVHYLEDLSLDWRSIDWHGVFTSVVNFLRDGAGNMLSSTISAATNLVSAVATFLIALVFSLYILMQKEKLGLQCRKAIVALLPQRYAQMVFHVASLSSRIFASFITGQCTESVILGTMFFAAMSILQMPYALLVGCLIAVTAIIPYVGAFIGCAVGALLLLLISPMKALIFLVVFVVLQQIEGNIIYPHVVGNSVGLPSIWVLAAVTIGGNLMGIFGMIVFIPIVSVCYTLFREYVYARLQKKGVTVE